MDTPFAYTPKSAWDNADAAARKDMDALAARYVDFLSRCKTERETVAYVCERLKAQGYAATGDKVVRPLRGKAVFAARRGALPLEKGLNLVAAHADSPRLDFKQRPLVEQAGVAQAKTHYYGGIRKYQWLGAPSGPARGGRARGRHGSARDHWRKTRRTRVLYCRPAAPPGAEAVGPTRQRGF